MALKAEFIFAEFVPRHSSVCAQVAGRALGLVEGVASSPGILALKR